MQDLKAATPSQAKQGSSKVFHYCKHAGTNDQPNCTVWHLGTERYLELTETTRRVSLAGTWTWGNAASKAWLGLRMITLAGWADLEQTCVKTLLKAWTETSYSCDCSYRRDCWPLKDWNTRGRMIHYITNWYYITNNTLICYWYCTTNNTEVSYWYYITNNRVVYYWYCITSNTLVCFDNI